MVHLSYGFLVYHENEDQGKQEGKYEGKQERQHETKEQPILYHIIQRRDSYQYVAFLSGKTLIDKLPHAVTYMTHSERDRLLKYDYDDLIRDLFIRRGLKSSEYWKAKTIFNDAKDSGKLSEILSENKTISPTLDWGLPKGGRKNVREPPLICALREYREETCNRSYIDIIDVNPIVNEHIGTDGKLYRVFYFIAKSRFKTNTRYIATKGIRKSCVSEETQDLRWCSSDQAQSLITPYLRDTIQQADYILSTDVKTIDLASGAEKWTQEYLKSLIDPPVKPIPSVLVQPL